tara:strand:- start:975 stop:1139 length:165 start_codon:yes stop_codon:yes gene_type:complete
MAALIITGALATVITQEDKQTSQAQKAKPIMVEEYTFEPIHIYVPHQLQDAGLD